MTTEKENGPERDFGRSERGYNSYNREGEQRNNRYENSYNRRPSYNHDSNNRNYGNSYERSERRFNPNREEGNTSFRPSYNKPRFNNNESGQRPYGNRAPRPRINEGYHNTGYRDFNREEGYENRQERPYRPRFNGDERPQRPRTNSGYQRDGERSGGFRPRNNYYAQGGGYERRPQQGFRPRTSGYNPNAKYSMKKQIEYKDILTDPNEPIRLNKFLANAGICSRREADEFITAGVVSVNGVVVTELGTKVKRDDEVKFHDQPVSIERKVYILLNKPKDCVTTTDDPQERKTVLNLVANACRERIYPVGRLDRNTTGVLLLTNDGEMASKLTHPKYLKKKIYHVYCDKNVTRADLDQIVQGIELPDGEIHADAVSYASETDKSQVGIEIHSGRNRIVRRIFEALGYRVIKLDRVYFAGLTKKGLRRGDWRFLTEAEVNILRMGAFE